MNREAAISVIEASVSRGTSTPCSWAADRDAYISETSAALLRHVIDPVQVTVAAETYHYGVKDSFENKSVYAIARSENNWLLYVLELEVFSLAFGETPEKLTILGFATNDALAEWLG